MIEIMPAKTTTNEIRMTASVPSRLSAQPFGEYWDKLPRIEENGYVNPFKIYERLAIYRLLIELMNATGAFGPGGELNMFWGYVSQLDWQWRSGRLSAPDAMEKDAGQKQEIIAVESWWAGCNYSLCVIPLIAAMRIGLAPTLEISIPKTASDDKFARAGGPSRPWVLPKVYEQALRSWDDFFRHVRSLRPDQDLEPARRAMWQAHLASIRIAAKLFTEEKDRLSQPEQTFAFGWLRMVDFLGLAAWRTDFSFIAEYGRGALPPRVLRADDRLGAVPDMDSDTNITLLNIARLGQQNRIQFAINRYLWQRAMRTRQARDEAPRLLAAIFDNSPQYAQERRRLQAYMLGRS